VARFEYLYNNTLISRPWPFCDSHSKWARTWRRRHLRRTKGLEIEFSIVRSEVQLPGQHRHPKKCLALDPACRYAPLCPCVDWHKATLGWWLSEVEGAHEGSGVGGRMSCSGYVPPHHVEVTRRLTAPGNDLTVQLTCTLQFNTTNPWAIETWLTSDLRALLYFLYRSSLLIHVLYIIAAYMWLCEPSLELRSYYDNREKAPIDS
jgi:hypothetical protein